MVIDRPFLIRKINDFALFTFFDCQNFRIGALGIEDVLNHAVAVLDEIEFSGELLRQILVRLRTFYDEEGIADQTAGIFHFHFEQPRRLGVSPERKEFDLTGKI